MDPASPQACGVRRLWSLIEQLPLEAAIWRKEAPGWKLEHELLALIPEVMDGWQRYMARVWGAKQSQLPEAFEVEHPERDRARDLARRLKKEDKPKLTTDKAEIAAFFRERTRRG